MYVVHFYTFLNKDRLYIISYTVSYTTEFTTSGIDEESLQIKSEATVRQMRVFKIATFICHTAEKETGFFFQSRSHKRTAHRPPQLTPGGTRIFFSHTSVL